MTILDTKEDDDDVPVPVVPLITTETLQYRIDTQNFGKSGGQRGSLTRCAQKYGSFQSELLSLPSSNDNDKGNNIGILKLDLVREVELFNLEITKLILWSNNLETQIKRNKVIQSKKGKKIIDMQNQVEESSIRTNTSLRRRNCIMEYESLAKVINDKHPISSTELKKQIDEIKLEISLLEDETIAKDEMLKVRGSQYQLLIQYMLDLKQSMKEDDDENDGVGVDNNKPKPMEVDDDDDLYGDL
mmetsp:Transcript_56082/g.60695  ORF Transcript_56082/g.60695 Transcript_56082/m.60695 type:complete len:244 (-) Transcript_56082:101-832(-)